MSEAQLNLKAPERSEKCYRRPLSIIDTGIGVVFTGYVFFIQCNSTCQTLRFLNGLRLRRAGYRTTETATFKQPGGSLA